MSEKIFIDYPPRIEPQLPSGVYNIPNPPDTKTDFKQLIQQAFLPMIMIMGYVMVSVFGKGSNMMMMIPMLLSIVATVSLAIYSNVKERKQRQEDEEAYKRRISELRRRNPYSEFVRPVRR